MGINTHPLLDVRVQHPGRRQAPQVIFSHPDGPTVTFDKGELLMTAHDGKNAVSVEMGQRGMVKLGHALMYVCPTVHEQYPAFGWALAQLIKPASAKQILMVLAHNAGQADGDAWIAFASVQQLVQETGQDRKTVVRNLERLVEQGYIVACEGSTAPSYMLTGSTHIGDDMSAHGEE